MLIVSVIFVNVLLYFAFVLFCRLTRGLNKCNKHLVGKMAIVTGASTGIGYEIAKNLAERGAKVIIASQNDKRGTTARDKIVEETLNNDIQYKKLNLGSFKSVREFADDILKNEKRVDILVNNAGIHALEKKKTADDLLEEMQINYFGPFLLTSLLLPILKKSTPSRIINVSSSAYSFGDIDFDNLNGEKAYHPNKVYNTSKLCNILMAVELTKRLKGSGVTINAVHPGVVITEPWAGTPFLPLVRLAAKSPWEGAQTAIHVAVSPEVKNVSGKYFVDCNERPTSRKVDDEVARKLWVLSEKIVKEKGKGKKD